MTDQPRPRRPLPAAVQRFGALAKMRLARPFGVLAVMLLLLLGAALVSVTVHRLEQQAQQASAERAQAALRPVSEQERREYVLEVIGLGVTLDNYRQHHLWETLQRSGARGSARQDPARHNDWSAQSKLALSAGRVCDSFDNAVRRTPSYWPAPSFAARPPIEDRNAAAGPDDPVLGVAANGHCAGLAPHQFVNAPWMLAERPDRLLERVFAFFDAHPDLPYVVLSADDGPGRRDEYRASGSVPLVRKGIYQPAMPDSSAVLVLARRERVERLRAHLWDDSEDAILSQKLGAAFGDLARTLRPSRVPQEQIGGGRAPMVAEWLPVAAAFAARASGDLQMRSLARKGAAWKATPWLPIPWTAEQMDIFDSLPTLGYIHRPRFVVLADGDRRQAVTAEQRQRLLEAGWDDALLTLPAAERARAPARMLVAGGTTPPRLLDGLVRHARGDAGEAAGPRPAQQVLALEQRFGNTGAATLFVQIALGVIASYRDGGTSAALNLRGTDEASIVLISPPSAATRAAQGPLFGVQKAPSPDP